MLKNSPYNSTEPGVDQNGKREVTTTVLSVSATLSTEPHSPWPEALPLLMYLFKGSTGSFILGCLLHSGA